MIERDEVPGRVEHDPDGVEAPGDTEYFVRVMLDRPPDVRVLRPGGDKQVMPLEEVLIEARAEDDYGIDRLDLVFQSPGGKEKVIGFLVGQVMKRTAGKANPQVVQELLHIALARSS